jgi:hypothetical protein
MAIRGARGSGGIGPWLLGGALLLAGSATARAQTFIGPAKCIGCHDHERQATKWQKEEPALFKGKAHFLTLKQLDGPKSAGFAKAIGLADPYDLKGSCVKCHGTVFKGDANAGVSCESCHGAASNYNDLHQTKGSYDKAVAAGMKDLRNKANTIAKVCVDCHITPDPRLAAAGHPSGSTFDAGASLKKIVHWNATYDFAQITAAGKTAAAGRAPKGGPQPSTAGGPIKPPPSKGPGPGPEPGASEGPPGKGGSTKQVAPTTPATPPPPWDWDQPVAPLPSDYQPEAVATPEPAAAATTQRRSRPRPVPASLAEDSPLPPASPGGPEAGPASAAVAPGAAAAPAPPSPAAQVAGLRGQGVAAVEKLLRSGAKAPDLPPPAAPDEFQGPDAELLRLQDEVLALAIQALRGSKP